LSTLRLVEEAANVLLIGPPGVGKTHLASGLDHQAAIEGRWATTMRFFAGPALLIVDELGHLPLASEAAAALFQVISRRYLRGSIVLTTNRGIATWGQIFDDPVVAAAMLDRLLHRSTVLNIEGESYRMRAHRERVEQLRKGLTAAGRV
jgi:DNA replication protein DnaC